MWAKGRTKRAKQISKVETCTRTFFLCALYNVIDFSIIIKHLE